METNSFKAHGPLRTIEEDASLPYLTIVSIRFLDLVGPGETRAGGNDSNVGGRFLCERNVEIVQPAEQTAEVRR